MKVEEPLLIRPAHRSEAGQLADISRLHVEHGLQWRWKAGRIEAHVVDRGSRVLVASRRGIVAGFSVMKMAEVSAHLFLLAVKPEFRNCGIGRSLLSRLEADCLAAGIRTVRLEVRAANMTARRFYESMGYRSATWVHGYYDGREAAIVMTRSIAGS